MSQLQVEGGALLATLLSMFLISWGSTGGPTAVAVIGGVLLAAGLAALTVLRYLDLEPDADDAAEAT